MATCICRQPSVGPWQKASEHKGPQSSAAEPRSGGVQGGAGCTWSWSGSKPWSRPTWPQGVKDLVLGQTWPQEALL